jgi:hypothetical protein
VADPRETIAEQQTGEQQPRLQQDDRAGELGQRQQRTDHMQAARRAVGVFAEVERVEVVKAGEGHGGISM